MSNLIERNNTADAMERWLYDGEDNRTVREVVYELPSAQPELAQNLHTTCTDAISRQAAIDLLKQMRKDGDMIPWEGKDVFARIRKLPSAQPEIIHCRDCKHHWTHRCMDSMPTEICDLNQTFYDPNIDFCSLAERRTDE